MDDAEVKVLLRAQGMCGRVVDGHACILERRHDDGAHEKGWTVVKRLQRPAYSRDERDADDVYWDVKEAAPQHVRDVRYPERVFTTSNMAHAEWLASTLTRLEL